MVLGLLYCGSDYGIVFDLERAHHFEVALHVVHSVQILLRWRAVFLAKIQHNRKYALKVLVSQYRVQGLFQLRVVVEHRHSVVVRVFLEHPLRQLICFLEYLLEVLLGAYPHAVVERLWVLIALALKVRVIGAVQSVVHVAVPAVAYAFVGKVHHDYVAPVQILHLPPAPIAEYQGLVVAG